MEDNNNIDVLDAVREKDARRVAVLFFEHYSYKELLEEMTWLLECIPESLFYDSFKELLTREGDDS